jgi:exopolysaccharide biosynthesis protein
MIRLFFGLCLLSAAHNTMAQLRWIDMTASFGNLPASVQVFKTTDTLADGKPNISWYLVADLKDKSLLFTVDTTAGRRLTPQQYYDRNRQPLAVMNTTFFSFATHQNLNTVIQNGKMVGYNIHSLAGKGKDTLTYRHPFTGALGITKKRRADIAWIYTDSSLRTAYASQAAVDALKDSLPALPHRFYKQSGKLVNSRFKKWKMETAVGGGPVLVQNGKVQISNNEEIKFPGKAIDDKHPRTAMGYTADGKLILLVVEGRNPGIAEGASLTQLAMMLQQVGCYEALNVDGGGSSCLLVNGKTTIYPSDKGQQRPVPAVFMIQQK